MSLLSKGARAVARPSKQLVNRQNRRYDSHDSHQAGHGHGESALHVDGGAGAGRESFGKGFYITLSLIPLTIIAYSVASSSDKPFLTGFIEKYQAHQAELSRRNHLNQIALEHASADRQLFVTQKKDTTGPSLAYPETFNTGSPWNVVAGEGGADLSQLTQHYVQDRERAEAARKAAVKDRQVTTVYDDTTGGRFPSWVPLIGKKEK